MKITTRGRIVVALLFAATAAAQITNLITSPVQEPDRYCFATPQECAHITSLTD